MNNRNIWWWLLCLFYSSSILLRTRRARSSSPTIGTIVGVRLGQVAELRRASWPSKRRRSRRCRMRTGPRAADSPRRPSRRWGAGRRSDAACGRARQRSCRRPALRRRARAVRVRRLHARDQHRCGCQPDGDGRADEVIATRRARRRRRPRAASAGGPALPFFVGVLLPVLVTLPTERDRERGARLCDLVRCADLQPLRPVLWQGSSRRRSSPSPRARSDRARDELVRRTRAHGDLRS